VGQALTFIIGDDEFGIGIGSAVEVLRPRVPRQVPDMPEYVSGFITVRRDVLPLIDLKRRFGVRSSPARERVLVVRYAAEKVALLVDGVEGIIKYEDARLKKPPALFRGLKAKYLSGLLEIDGKPVILLDVANILTSKEKIALKRARDRIKKDEVA
jgi:purine-binding chemotaxis protein CheW